MLPDELRKLIQKLENASLRELKCRRDVSKRELDYKQTEMLVIKSAYETGRIDGKNADIRKAQEASVLSYSSEITSALFALNEVESEFDRAVAKHDAIKAEIALTKAWLYSQASIG